MSKKICFFQYNLEPGGLQVYLLRFLQFMGNRVEATVICKSGVSGELEKQYVEAGATVICVKSLYISPSAWLKIFKIFKSEKFDSVSDLTGNFSGIYVLLAKLAGIKKRMGYFGNSSINFSTSFFNRAYNNFVNRLTYYFSTHIVLNSWAALEYYFPYRQKSDKKFSVIFNGIDSSVFSDKKDNIIRRQLGIPDNAFVIGHTGRYDHRKNHGAIIKMAVLLKEFEDIYFIIAGKDTDQIMPEVEKAGLKRNFYALGYRTDVNEILRNFNAFYFPSYTEGQPNSLIEALMTGLPIVASNIGPIKDTVPQSLWSQLVAPNDVEAAVEKVLAIKKDSTFASSLNYRQWAIDAFDASLRFTEYYDCL